MFHQLISFCGDVSYKNNNNIAQQGVRYFILTVEFVVVMSGMLNKNVLYANALHLECKYNVKI